MLKFDNIKNIYLEKNSDSHTHTHKKKKNQNL